MLNMLIRTKKLEEFLNLNLVKGINEIEIVLDKEKCDSLGTKAKLTANATIIVSKNAPEYALLKDVSDFKGVGVIKYSDSIRAFKKNMIDYIKYDLDEIEKNCSANSDGFIEIVTSINEDSFMANKVLFRVFKKSYFNTAANRLAFFAKNAPMYFSGNEQSWDESEYVRLDNKIYRILFDNKLSGLKDNETEVIRVDGSLFALRRTISELNLLNEVFDELYFYNDCLYEEIFKNYPNAVLCDAYSYDTGELTFYKKYSKEILFKSFDSESFNKLIDVTWGEDKLEVATASFNGIEHVLQKVYSTSRLVDGFYVFNKSSIYRILSPVEDFYFSLNRNNLWDSVPVGYREQEINASKRVTKSIQRFIDSMKNCNSDEEFNYTIYNDTIFNKDFDCVQDKRVSLIVEPTNESNLVGVEGVVSTHNDGSLYVKVKYHGYFVIETKLSNIKILE